MASNYPFIEEMDLAGKRMVVLGCGYVGTRVARQGLKAGMRVTALTRNTEQAAELRRVGIHEVVTADIDGAEWHSWIDSRQDFVLDCVSSAGGGVVGYQKSYLEGMRSLLRWASGGEVGTVVFTSSTSVYGQNKGEWVTEADLAEGASDGGKILRQAECLLEEPSEAVRRGFILRLGGIYGPGRHRLLDSVVPASVGESGDVDERSPATEDPVFLNSIHVDDAVAAIWAAFLADPAVKGGAFNIVDDLPTPKGEIIAFLREKVKERGLVRSEAGVSGRVRYRGARPNRKISNRKARELLGWSPRFPDFRVGYEPLLASFEEEGPR